MRLIKSNLDYFCSIERLPKENQEYDGHCVCCRCVENTDMKNEIKLVS